MNDYELHLAKEFAKKYMLKYTNKPYHNWLHVLDVEKNSKKIAMYEGCSRDDVLLLQIISWFHDIENHFPEKKSPSDEEVSAQLAENYLKKTNCTIGCIAKIKLGILSTAFCVKTDFYLGKIIKDADIYHTGTSHFNQNSENIRLELPIMSDYDWFKTQKDFFEKIEYQTSFGKTYLEPGRQANLNTINKKLVSLIEKEQH